MKGFKVIIFCITIVCVSCNKSNKIDGRLLTWNKQSKSIVEKNISDESYFYSINSYLLKIVKKRRIIFDEMINFIDSKGLDNYVILESYISGKSSNFYLKDVGKHQGYFKFNSRTNRFDFDTAGYVLELFNFFENQDIDQVENVVANNNPIGLTIFSEYNVKGNKKRFNVNRISIE